MKNSDNVRRKKEQTFFAVTALGKNRWYWVVWPSLEMLQSEQSIRHVANGYQRTKIEAVDQALEAAGLHGEWVAAKYAKAYHRQLTRQNRIGQTLDSASHAIPVVLEFLYRDIQDQITKQWYSVPHRIIKKTKKYIHVEQHQYDPAQLTGSWLDHDAPTFRLSRTMLEQEGYTFTPITEIEDPLFFTTPYQERVVQFARQPPACLRHLKLSFPCTKKEVKAAYRKLAKNAHPDHGGSDEEFLALQTAYEQALRLCRK